MSFIYENLYWLIPLYFILGLIYITLQAWFYDRFMLGVTGIQLLVSYLFWCISAIAFLLILWVHFIVGFKKGWKNVPTDNPK